MISTHPRLMCFSGGPYDGAEEWLKPVVDDSGKARLSHLTEMAFHRYETDVPFELYGPCDTLVMYHDPSFITLRATRGCQS